MRHRKAKMWEMQLKRIFDEIDAVLESEYSGDYKLHPSRARRGATSNPEYDGLFNIGASFSPGYGSSHGRGYVVQVHMSTLARVPPDVRKTIDERVVQLLNEKLPETFPGKKLTVKRDGSIYKIIGDLSLGSV